MLWYIYNLSRFLCRMSNKMNIFARVNHTIRGGIWYNRGARQKAWCYLRIERILCVCARPILHRLSCNEMNRKFGRINMYIWAENVPDESVKMCRNSDEYYWKGGRNAKYWQRVFLFLHKRCMNQKAKIAHKWYFNKYFMQYLPHGSKLTWF